MCDCEWKTHWTSLINVRYKLSKSGSSPVLQQVTSLFLFTFTKMTITVIIYDNTLCCMHSHVFLLLLFIQHILHTESSLISVQASITFTYIIFLMFSYHSRHIHNILILFCFIHFFLGNLSLSFTVSFVNLVSVGSGKAKFLHRDHLISPSTPHKAPLWASAYCVIRIYCTVAQWFWFCASETVQFTLVALVKGVNGIWTQLWHQSNNIISLFWAKSLD